MILRRYCVTVMDNWTPMRSFWTLRGAKRFRDRFYAGAIVWKWDGRSREWRFQPTYRSVP